MSGLPRLALGTVQSETDATAILWGLLAALDRRGLGVQNFLSRACFARRDGATAITGLAPRHLDSWLMGRDLCCQALLRGMRRADIAVVEGSFVSPDFPSSAHSASPRESSLPERSFASPGSFVSHDSDENLGGSLTALCDWLSLPRLAIVDAQRLADCRLPARPDALDGILLDGVADHASLCRLQTHLESLWGVPVLGALGPVVELRAAIGRLTFGQSPAPELIAALATALERFTDIDRLQRLACKYDFPFRGLEGSWQRPEHSSLRIAMACDEAFRCYFPDTLEAMELKGATICDFSPLKDERLPPESDIVYFGCGRPDLFADELASNTCMASSLREHLCNGRRIYAECGGLAYLSRQIELPDGRLLPMAGALPVTARLREPEAPRPIAARLNADCWLGRQGTLLRGYLNSRWTFSGVDQSCTGAAPLPATAPEQESHNMSAGNVSPSSVSPGNVSPGDMSPGSEALRGALQQPADAWSPPLIARHQAIGSRLHLNFAAQPDVLEAFFHPHAAMMDIDAPALARAL